MLTDVYEKKKKIESNKMSLKKKNLELRKKLKNNKNEIFAPCEHDKRYLFNYYFISKTLIVNITFFKIDEIKKSRREYFEIN